MTKLRDGYFRQVDSKVGDDNYLLKAKGGYIGLHTGRNNEPNKVVRTDEYGYIQAGWINTTSGSMDGSTPTRIYASYDGYIRYMTPAYFFSTFENSTNNQVSITIGGQNRKLSVNADKLDGYHKIDLDKFQLNYIYSNGSDPSILEVAINENYNNKFFNYDINYILVEESSNGTSWTTKSISEEKLKNLLGGTIGTDITIPANTYLRFEFTPTSYCYISTLFTYHCYTGEVFHIKIERKHSTSSDYEVLRDWTGLSGWPSTSCQQFTNTPFSSSYYNKFRVTFRSAGTDSHIYRLRVYGGYPNSYNSLISVNGYGQIYNNILGNASSATKLQAGRYLWGRYFDGTTDIVGKAQFASKYFYNTQPSLGALDDGTIEFRATTSSGALCNYGLFIYDDYWSGLASLQSGYTNGSTNALPIALQPLGGNVGIGMGTSLPSEKLEIWGNLRICNPNDSQTLAKFLNYSNSPYGLILKSYSNGAFHLQSQRENNNSETFPILLNPNGGNVGIGTTSPGHKLVVNGNFSSSNYQIYGSVSGTNCNSATYTGIWYYSSNGPATQQGTGSTDGSLWTEAYSDSWVGQIAQDYRTGTLFTRSRNNGTWTRWKTIAPADSDFEMAPIANIVYNPYGRKFTKFAGTNGSWDTHAYSTVGYKECRLTYKIGQTNAYIMVGLNSDPTYNASYDSIDYCWYTQSGGSLNMYESGSGKSSITGHTSYSTGDEFVIEYVNGYVRYYHNGVLCREIARSYGTPLYFDSSFHNYGYIYDVVFEPIRGYAYDVNLMSKVTDWNTVTTSIFKSSERSTTNAPTTGFIYGTTLRFHREWTTYYTDLVVDLYNDKMFFRRKADGSFGSWRELLHSGNYTTWVYAKSDVYTKTESDNRFVNVTGDTMSASLNFNNGGNWISSINTTRDGIGSGTMGGIDGNGMYFSQTPSGGSMSYMYLKGGTGLSIAGNIYPIGNCTYNIGNSSSEWAHASIRVVCTRHLDADDAYSGDNNLYIGYGAGKQTNKTLFYYSTSDSRNQFAEINSAGLYALTRFGVAGQSTSYTFYVNGTSYLNNLVTVNTANDTHRGVKVGNTYINAINGELILQNNTCIRFGGDSWDYNIWAGLKYVHSSKIIYLGLADGSAFSANNAQSGGSIYTPGISNIYIGNGSYVVWHSNNDGSGSGLDADLLDGKHYTDIIRSNGRNLIRNYDIETSSSSYQCWGDHIFTETVAQGEQVTITVEYSLSSGATKTWLAAYTGGGYASIASFTATPGISHNIQSVTTTMSYASGHNNNGVCLFYGPNSSTGTATIYRVKVERGDHFTGWTAAPEDLMNIYGAQTVTGTKTFNTSIIMNQTSSDRRVGIIGTYDPNRAAAIWSMGPSYQINAAGTSLASLYGAAYVYFGSGYTFGAGYSGGHSFVWAQGGSISAALGNYIWSSGGFIKSGSDNTYVLEGGGGHYSLNNILHGDSYGTMEGVISDCNSVSVTGIYSHSGFSNRPDGVLNWGTLFNLRLYNSNNSYHRQLFFDCYSSDKIWTRSDSGGTWTSWKELITSANIASQSVNYANSAGSVDWSNVQNKPSTFPPSSHSHAAVDYLYAHYNGGDKPNPQEYFNENIGVKVAMTRYATIGGSTAWHDTLWINGYTGSDVPYVTSLTFRRDGTPRFFVHSQSNRATSYGTYYEVITGYNIGSQSVNYATSAGSAGSATSASYSYRLLNQASIGSSSDSHATALQNYFNANKSSIYRNELRTYYSNAYGNGSFYMGYFLSGYDSNPYGGFFVAHYGTPYYVGITAGTYSQQAILTSTNWSSYITTSSADDTVWQDNSNSTKYKIQVVSSLPSSPNSNTFYVIV